LNKEVENLYKDYLEYIKSLNSSGITLKRRGYAPVKLFDFMEAEKIKDLQTITPDDMNGLKTYLKSNVGQSMHEIYLVGINHFFKYLEIQGIIKVNPLEKSRDRYGELDYPDELKKYYCLYLAEVRKANRLPQKLRIAFNSFFKFLITKGIDNIKAITAEITAEYDQAILKEKKTTDFKGTYYFLIRYHLKNWFKWLSVQGINSGVNGEIFPPEERQLTPLEKEFCRFLEKKGYSRSSLYQLKPKLDRLAEFMTEYQITDITKFKAEDINGFRVYLKKRGYGKNYREGLTLLLKYCVLTGRISENPFEAVNKTLEKKVKIKANVLDRIPAEHRQLYADYLAYLKLTGHRKRGINVLRLRSRDILDYMQETGIKSFTEMGVKEAINYQGWIMEKGRCKKGRYNNNTVTGYLRSASCLFNYLKVRKLIYTNPFREIKRLRREKKLPAVLKEKQMSLLLKELSDFNSERRLKDKMTKYRIHVICELMYASGLRSTEAAELRLEDIDFTRGLVKVNDGKQGESRITLLNEYAVKVLELYVNEMRELTSTRSNKKNDTLFGTRFDPFNKTLNKKLKEAVKKLSLPHITSHGFRHALGAHLLRSGCDIRYIQAILGHKRLTSTEIYTKIEKEDLKEVLDRYHPRQFNKEQKP
jgi:integrase/recombinase XerC